jgi:hypothetical protein
VSTTTADVEAYAGRVRTALGDLAAADRDDLLADLEDHLVPASVVLGRRAAADPRLR